MFKSKISINFLSKIIKSSKLKDSSARIASYHMIRKFSDVCEEADRKFYEIRFLEQAKIIQNIGISAQEADCKYYRKEILEQAEIIKAIPTLNFKLEVKITEELVVRVEKKMLDCKESLLRYPEYYKNIDERVECAQEMICLIREMENTLHEKNAEKFHEVFKAFKEMNEKKQKLELSKRPYSLFFSSNTRKSKEITELITELEQLLKADICRPSAVI